MKTLQQLGGLRRSAGVSIVTAIFLLVVLSGLAAAIVTVTTAQQSSSALDVLGTRAYQAARAGVEYGLFRELQGGSACAGAVSFNPPAQTLTGFTVTVQCTQTGVTGAAGTVREIVATACNQPAGGTCPNAAPTSAEYVQRVISVQFGG